MQKPLFRGSAESRPLAGGQLLTSYTCCCLLHPLQQLLLQPVQGLIFAKAVQQLLPFAAVYAHSYPQALPALPGLLRQRMLLLAPGAQEFNIG